MSEDDVQKVLQEEFDMAVEQWGKSEATRILGGAAQISPREVSLYHGQAEGVKRIALRLGLTLKDDDLGDDRLHTELVKHGAIDI